MIRKLVKYKSIIIGFICFSIILIVIIYIGSNIALELITKNISPMGSNAKVVELRHDFGYKRGIYCIITYSYNINGKQFINSNIISSNYYDSLIEILNKEKSGKSFELSKTSTREIIVPKINILLPVIYNRNHPSICYPRDDTIYLNNYFTAIITILILFVIILSIDKIIDIRTKRYK